MSDFFKTPKTAAFLSEVTGLTLIAINLHGTSNAVPTAVLRLAIESSMYAQDQGIGLKASSKKGFRSLWAGSNEELMGVRHMYRQKPDHMRPPEVVSVGEFEYDWLDGPGYNATAKHVEAGVRVVSCFWSPGQTITPRAAANLAKLRVLASQHACHVIVFVVMPEAHFNAAELRGMTDRTLVIKPCEPDPEWAWAVSAEFISQGYFDVNRSKTMCQLNSNGHGFPVAVFEPYLHDALLTRVWWHMRMRGALNKDIASAFGVSGSTITRALQHLPKYPKSWKSDEQVERLLALVLNTDDPAEISGKKPSTCDDSDLVDNENDDEEDEDEDDDFTYVPKKSSKLKKRH